jgi:hypothetical protein
MENIEVRNAISKLLSVSKEKSIISKFARKKYEDKFAEANKKANSLMWYEGFEIVNENTIKIKYGYGEDFTDDFIVNI